MILCSENMFRIIIVRGVRAREFQSFLFFTFLLCHSNHKNITRIAHSNREKITPKSTLECALDYDEYLTRASRSNTGTCCHICCCVRWYAQLSSHGSDVSGDFQCNDGCTFNSRRRYVWKGTRKGCQDQPDSSFQERFVPWWCLACCQYVVFERSARA